MRIADKCWAHREGHPGQRQRLLLAQQREEKKELILTGVIHEDLLVKVAHARRLSPYSTEISALVIYTAKDIQPLRLNYTSPQCKRRGIARLTLLIERQKRLEFLKKRLRMMK